MEDSYYKSLEPFWGCWHIVKKLGEGAYGKVYKVEREEFDKKYYSALKIITIPPTESDWLSTRSEGMDEVSTTEYYRSVVKEIIEETMLMSELRGNSNIVSYEDHMVLEHSNGHGWDILIRMELLTPFLETIPEDRSMDRDAVIKLGLDICRALEICHMKNIIHRDIKPENFFINSLGDYKLGDFGIAKTIEKTTGMSKKGTYSYMAPEVYKEEPYNASVDIYSLGIVLYRLTNRNRLPFLPPYPQPVDFTSKDTALKRRISGENIPYPIDAQDDLGKIIIKACSYNVKDRFSSATEMRLALEGLKNQSYDLEKTTSIWNTINTTDNTDKQNNIDNLLESGGISHPESHRNRQSQSIRNNQCNCLTPFL